MLNSTIIFNDKLSNASKDERDSKTTTCHALLCVTLNRQNDFNVLAVGNFRR